MFCSHPFPLTKFDIAPCHILISFSLRPFRAFDPTTTNARLVELPDHIKLTISPVVLCRPDPTGKPWRTMLGM